MKYELDASNFSSTINPLANQTKDEAISARPSETQFNWGFRSQGQDYEAVSQSLTRSKKDGGIRQSIVDISAAAAGQAPLAMTRYYNSFYDKEGGFGLGWQIAPFSLRFPADKRGWTFGDNRLSLDAYYQIYVTQNGSEYLYTLAGINSANLPIYMTEGGQDYLLDNLNGTLSLLRKNGPVKEILFKGDGRLSRIIDVNGIYVEYNWEGRKLISIVHSKGKRISLNYDGDAIISANSSEGRVVRYEYYPDGQLKSVTNPENETVTYYYDADKRLSKAEDAEGTIVFEAVYDDYNRAETQKAGTQAEYSSAFSLSDRMSEITAPNNVKMIKYFDSEYRPAQVNDFLNNRVNMNYATDFGPEQIIDSQGNITRYGYDGQGNLNYIRDASGNERMFYYDLNNNLIAARGFSKQDTVYEYDDKNRLITIYSSAELEFDSERRFTGRYAYDTKYAVRFAYDPGNGNLLSVTDARGPRQSITYDANGMPKIIKSLGGYEVSNSYDNLSRLTKVANAGGEAVSFSYDNADRPKTITTAAGTITYGYDRNGNVDIAKDANGNATDFDYDDNGNLVKVTDAEAGATLYEYDVLNQLVKIALPNGTIREIEYDELSRPVMEIYRGRTQPRIAVAANEFDLGTTPIGTPLSRQLEIYNVGDGTLDIGSISVDNGSFSAQPSSALVGAGSEIGLNITFSAADIGRQTGVLTVNSNDPRQPIVTVALSAEVTLNALNTKVISERDGIRLSWDRYQGTARFDHYNIYRSLTLITDVSELTPIWSAADISRVNYLDTGAAIGTAYYYAVVAFDVSGNPLTLSESVGPIYYLNLGRVGGFIDVASASNNENNIVQVYNSADQEYLLVYEYDVSGAGANFDIYGQRISGTGDKIGPAFAVFNSGYGERSPQVAWNSSRNEYMVVCEYDSNGAGLYQASAQRVSASGALLGSPKVVFSTIKAQSAPCIVYNSAENGYLAAFASDYNSDGKDDLLWFVLDAENNIIFGKVKWLTDYIIKNPKAAYNSRSNEYMIASELTDNAGFWLISVFSLNNTADITNIGLIAWNRVYSPSAVIYNPARDEYAFCFEYDYLGSGAEYALGIAVVNADMCVITSNYFSASGNSLLYPAIAYYASKSEYAVAFTNRISASGEYNLQVCRIAAANLSSVTAQTMCAASEEGRIERKSALAYNSAIDEFLVSYEYNNGSNYDIRGQRIGTIARVLSIAPAGLDFPPSLTRQTLEVKMISGETFMYLTNSVDQDWLAVTPAALITSSLSPAATLTVTTNRSGLRAGAYSGNVLVRCEGITERVPVTMEAANSAPNAPENPSPVDGAVGQAAVISPIKVTMDWSCSDPQGDALVYDVYFSRDKSLVDNADGAALAAQGLAEPEYTSSALDYSTDYYWRIKAADSGGMSSLGPVWRFATISISVPDIYPYLPDPVNNPRPELQWGAVYLAQKYRIQIDDTPDFSSPIIDDGNITDVKYTPMFDLPEGDIFWRVASIDSGSRESRFSDPDSLAIDLTPPPKAGLIGFLPDPTNNRRPVLRWNGAAGAQSYRLQISAAADFSDILTDVYVSGTEYAVVFDLPQGNIFWRVRARDLAGNTGEFSDADSFIVDVTAPEKINIASLISGFKTIRIDWPLFSDQQGDFDHFNIYRQEQGFSNVSSIAAIQRSDDVAAVTFSDGDVFADKDYYYALTAVDKAGNEYKAVDCRGPARLKENTPPVIEPDIPRINVPKGKTITIDLSHYKRDEQETADNLVWSVAGIDESLFGAQINADDLTITALSNAAGSDVITVYLTDSGGLSDSQEVAVDTADAAAPQVVLFAAADEDSSDRNYTNSRDVKISLETASDPAAVKWLINESGELPAAADFVLTVRPELYRIQGGEGRIILYAWAMDESGNVSVLSKDSVSAIDLDLTVPQVDGTAVVLDGKNVEISYNEPMLSAGNPLNYAVEGLTVDEVGEITDTKYRLTFSQAATSGENYTIVVSGAVDRAGNNLDSIRNYAVFSGYDALAPVFGGITECRAANKAAILRWRAAEDVSVPIKYNIYVAEVSGGQDFSLPNFVTQEVRFKVEGLFNDKDYFFVVRAQDSAGNEDKNTIELSACPNDGALSIVQGVNAAVSGDDAEVFWQPNPESGVSAYRVYYGRESGFYDKYKDIPSAQTNCRISIQDLRGDLVASQSSKSLPVEKSAVRRKLPAEYAPNEMIVKLSSASAAPAGFFSGSIKALNRKFNVRKVKRLFPEGPFVIKFSGRQDIEKAAAEYRKNPAVVYAEPNYRVRIFSGLESERYYFSVTARGASNNESDYSVEASIEYFPPSDPYFRSRGSWGQSYGDMWGLQRINIEDAWKIEKGADNAVVAVVDTGCNYAHDDLAENIWQNNREIPANGADDDNNGFIDDARGWDFAYGDNDPGDNHGHGTHVAGTIAAVTDNYRGVSGISWQSKIMVIKGLGDDGNGYISNLSSAIRYAADNGARIINNSWGGFGVYETINDAVDYAHGKGCIVVAAAGNEDDSSLFYCPANCANVIGVGAVEPDDNLADFSNWGAKIDVTAPGTDILSLDKDSGYRRSGGTSMACPHVCGVAALLLSKNPALTNDEVRQIIRASASDLGFPGRDDYFGYGLIDAAGALRMGSICLAEIDFPQNHGHYRGRIEIRGTVSGRGFRDYTIEYGRLDNPVVWSADYVTLSNAGQQPVIGGILASIDTDSLDEGDWTIRLTARDVFGTVSQAVRTFNIDRSMHQGWPIERPYNEFSSPVFSDSDDNGTTDIVAFCSNSPDNTRGRLHLIDSSGSDLPGWPKDTDVLLDCSPAIGDIDADGEEEIIVAGYDPEETEGERAHIFAYHLNGAPVSGWPKSDKYPVTRSSVALSDVDKDGVLDVIVCGYNREEDNSKVYVYNGSGRLISGWPVSLPGSIDATPAAGDIDNDGEIEIAALAGYGTAKLYVWEKDGSLSLGWPKDLGAGSGEQTASPTLGDIDADGKLEIIAAIRNLPGQPDIFVFNDDGSGASGWPVELGGQSRKTSPCLADLDKDGDIEIIVGTSSGRQGRLHIFGKDGTHLSGWPKDIGSQIWGEPAVVDLQADGKYEVIFGSGGVYPKIYIWDIDGNDLPGWPRTIEGALKSSPAAGDVDNDGYWELVSASAGAKVYQWDLAYNYQRDNTAWQMYRNGPGHSGVYGFANPQAQTLSLSIDRGDWELLNIAPGTEQIMGGTEKITVTNDGDGLQTYSIKITDEGGWASSADKDGAGIDRFVLSALFSSDRQENVDAGYFNETANDDTILFGISERAGAERFGSARLLPNGASVGPGEKRALWLNLKAPLKDTTKGARHSVKITVSAEAS